MKNAFVSADIIDVSGDPVRVIRLHVNHPYSFASGQYLNIIGPDDIFIPMSIASAPQRLPELELHYRPLAGAPEAITLNSLLGEKHLNVSPAQGDVRCGEPSKPLFVIAGGSGAAQAFSCAEHRTNIGATGVTTLLWCADKKQDIYNLEELSSKPNVDVTVCIDDRRTPENEGMVWLNRHADRFMDAYVLLAGSPGFVYTVTDLLQARGFKPEQLHADAYSYAPR